MKKFKKLLDEYRFPGYYPKATVKGKFGDNKAMIIQLVRFQKKLFVAVVAQFTSTSMTGKSGWSEICHAVMPESICQLKFAGLIV